MRYNAAMRWDYHISPQDPHQERDRNQHTIDAYDTGAEAYAATTPPVTDMHSPPRKWIDHALETLFQRGEIAHLPVLEIGSGTGRDAAYIESRGVAVQRTDATPAFVERLRRDGHDAKVLNALTDEYGGPYRMIFANAVFPHFSDEQMHQVTDKAFASLALNGLLAFSMKTTTFDRRYDQTIVEGWDTLVSPSGPTVPRKMGKERYYYVRNIYDTRRLINTINKSRNVGVVTYNTPRSYWTGFVVAKDGIQDMPESQTRISMPFPPL